MAGNFGRTGDSSGMFPGPKNESQEENSGTSDQLLETENPESVPEVFQTPAEPQVSRLPLPGRPSTQNRPPPLSANRERMETIKERLREKKRYFSTQRTHKGRRATCRTETTPPELKQLAQNFNPNAPSTSTDLPRPSVVPFDSTSPYGPAVPVTPEVSSRSPETSTSPFKPIVCHPVTPGSSKLFRPSLIHFPTSSPAIPNLSVPVSPEPQRQQQPSSSSSAAPPENPNQQMQRSSSLYTQLQTPQRSFRNPQSLLRRLQMGIRTNASAGGLPTPTDPILLGLAHQFERRFGMTLSRERLEYMAKDIEGLNHDTWVQAVIVVMAAVSSSDYQRWTPFQCFDQLMRSAKWILGGSAHIDLGEANFHRLIQLEDRFYPPHDLLGFEETRYIDWRKNGMIYDICPLAHVFPAPRWRQFTLSLIKLAYSDPQKVLSVFNRLQETMVFFV